MHDGGGPPSSVNVYVIVYVVDGDSVGTGTATKGMSPLHPVGIAYGVGIGEGAGPNAPTGTGALDAVTMLIAALPVTPV